MSDYRWDSSPYHPTPAPEAKNDLLKRLAQRNERHESALYKIALDAKSLEDAKHIAAEALYRQGTE